MFDSHFRTLFLSRPAHLRLESRRLIIELKDYPKSLKAIVANSHNDDTICHTARSEISKSQNEDRDISVSAKPQYDNEKKPQYDKNIDCHAKSSDFARNDDNHTTHTHTATIDEKNTQYTPYKSDKHDKVAIPLSDIACIILESPQITLTSALLDALSTHKVAVFSCDSSHLPSGIFMPFLGHYRSLSVLQSQITLKNQTKAILWQQIIKSKIYNQSAVLKLAKPNQNKTIATLENLAQSVNLGDSTNNEAQAAAVYFKALFGIDFARKKEGEISTNEIHSMINAALNYGYAIVRGAIVRSIASSGLSPALGLFHANSFNPFNLADDIIEPFRAFVDSLVIEMLEKGEFGKSSDTNDTNGANNASLTLQNRLHLAQILSAKICVKTHTKANADKASNKGKLYPLMRAVVVCVQSVVNAIEANGRLDRLTLSLPAFVEDISNGREIYEGASDV
ncbi:type II CRISPR-associated endonuclease Cas1 [Helicobacter sp. T3_23-1056]